MTDEIRVEILDDGRIKMTTPGISAANHRAADQFLELVNELMGGEVETTKIARGRVTSRGREVQHGRA